MTAKDRSPQDDDVSGGSFASPPCFMHELDPIYGGIATDPVQARDVASWRKAERQRLITLRLAVPVSEREEHARRLQRDLDAIVPGSGDTIVSVFWPFRGEPDLRPWMTSLCQAGLRVALPLAVAKGQPLVFREWTPGTRLEHDIWKIPYPADGAEVAPTMLVVPLVGFDPEGFRLGYGGGFFDRTLAAYPQKPLVVGIGHPVQAITTIFPQPHDIPMDWIVTGFDAPYRATGPR